MTELQYDMILQMFRGGGRYLLPKINHTGRSGYMLYEGNQNPVRWYSEKTVHKIDLLLKKDRKKRLTMNLALVRKQHGKSPVKQLYKKSKPGTVTLADTHEA